MPNVSQKWTVAESCAQLEELAAEFIAQAIDCRENLKRCQELDAVKRRAAFKLITPKCMSQVRPAIRMGQEAAFFELVEQQQKEMSELYPA